MAEELEAEARPGSAAAPTATAGSRIAAAF